jgi:hypothetical protein
MQNAETIEHKNANRDPITGAPGAHPVGTGLGAALGGAAAGAVTGTVAGPIGTVIGAAAGAIIGGLAGKGVAETVDPTVENAYWRDNFTQRPYVASEASFDDYGPAYVYGLHSSQKYADRGFDDIEPDLGRDWGSASGTSSLSWARARDASRDAWERARMGRDQRPLFGSES